MLAVQSWCLLHRGGERGAGENELERGPYDGYCTPTYHPPTVSHLLITVYHFPLTDHHTPHTTHHFPLTAHRSPLTTCRSPLTSRHSSFTAHHSPLTAHRSPLTARPSTPIHAYPHLSTPIHTYPIYLHPSTAMRSRHVRQRDRPGIPDRLLRLPCWHELPDRVGGTDHM